MDKKVVLHIHNEILLSYIKKKNTFESVLMRWMKVEPVIQSEGKSERETPIPYINAHIWNLERW